MLGGSSGAAQHHARAGALLHARSRSLARPRTPTRIGTQASKRADAQK